MFLSGSNFSYKYNVNNKITTLNKYLYVNGRIAFLSILDSIKKKKIKEIFLPNYICESLISVIDKNFFKINFYEVYDDFRISIPKLKNSIVLIINYFGIKHKLPNDIIKTNIIIEDKTFSFLNKSNPISKQKKNYYCFASFRKIHDGSIYAYSNILNKKTKKKSKKLENIYLNRIASSFLRDEYLKNEMCC